MSRIVIFGSTGQLGRNFTERFYGKHDIIPFSSRDPNIKDHLAVRYILEELKPEYVINCTSFNNVNGAERGFIDEAFSVNYLAIENLGKVCAELKINLITFSTDYVYNSYGEECPLNIYGVSKLWGERSLTMGNSAVIRLSWVFSPYLDVKYSFVKTVYNMLMQGESLYGVIDEISAVTYTEDVVSFVDELIKKDVVKGNKVYNFSNRGKVSRYTVIKYVAEVIGKPGLVFATTTEEYFKDSLELPVARPSQVFFDTQKADEIYIPRDYKEAINDCIEKFRLHDPQTY